jgi:RNA polymerase sigma-70 factor (ECF subfamily)
MTAAAGFNGEPPADRLAPESDPWFEAEPRDFPQVVRAESDRIWRLLRRLGVAASDADDATQQVFLVLARRWHELDRQRVRRFLYGTALRIAANARRSLRRRRELLDDAALDGPSRDATQDDTAETRRARALLDELLAELPDELRRVFVLAEIEELTTLAISELEAIPHGTASSRLRRARALFREKLERERHRNPFAREAP